MLHICPSALLDREGRRTEKIRGMGENPELFTKSIPFPEREPSESVSGM
jgi:hypothetical protein